MTESERSCRLQLYRVMSLGSFWGARIPYMGEESTYPLACTPVQAKGRLMLQL